MKKIRGTVKVHRNLTSLQCRNCYAMEVALYMIYVALLSAFNDALYFN